ncbi:MAG TPA: D-2-hydroxyacid dehydrogenase [Dehalococcoidia bacterium]|nr:D-2-hydroxyacid dehydrogenase [Dehalococcoidia bacterium]
MDTVNILLSSPMFDEENLGKITSVSPRVKVQDIWELARTDLKGDSAARDELDNLLADTEVVYCLRMPRDLITRAPKLKWVQVMSAGVDRFLDADFRKSPVILTNVSGMHATPIGEFVMEQMLMFAKNAAFCFDLKQKKQWQRYSTSVLRGKTVGIVGLGNIGREVARLSKAFGMRVVATRRSAPRIQRTRNVDLMLPRQELPRLLAESDYVVITLPYTRETHNLFGEKELKTMKPSAYLINIGRGGIVDEDVLVRALAEKWIAGAGLDVFATEPLPPESKLWDLPSLLFSPHVSGDMEDYFGQATDVFCKNLKRYLEGKRLFNVVNKQRGY